MVLKLIIRTSASPRRWWFHWGLRVTQDAYFSLLTHTKQLVLVTFCDTLAGIEVRFGRTEPDGRTEPRNDGWTDRGGSRNSYLDYKKLVFMLNVIIGYHLWIKVEMMDGPRTHLLAACTTSQKRGTFANSVMSTISKSVTFQQGEPKSE